MFKKVVNVENGKAPAKYELVFNATGNDVHLTVFEGAFLSDYKMRCSLAFAGSEQPGKNVSLEWDDPVWDPKGKENGEPMLRARQEEWITKGKRLDYKRREVTHEARLYSSSTISYTCRVGAERVADFANGAPPKECRIQFVSKE